MPSHDSSPQAVEELLASLYEELRKLAADKMAREAPGQTLQPTALVHEAWLRLHGEGRPTWENRAQFFAAAAEAMRRILIERSRRRQAAKRGSGVPLEPMDDGFDFSDEETREILSVHQALDGLAEVDSQAANLVKLRYFVGMTMEEAAASLNLPQRTAERLWTFGKAWLRQELSSG